MAAMYPAIPYQDLIQTYELRDTRVFPPKKPTVEGNSIWEFLQQAEYSIFRHIALVSQLQPILNSIQFQGTILLPTDEAILRDPTNRMEIFMGMDRNTARTILNYHIFPTVKTLKSILTRRFTKMDTRNPQSEICVQNKDGIVHLNGGRSRIIGEQVKSNGTILLIDALLVPPELYQYNYDLRM